MHARVTTIPFSPDNLDRAESIAAESIRPAARSQPGNLGYLLLVDRANGQTITISLWTDEQALSASDANGYYRDQLAKVVPLGAASPTTSTFVVSVCDLSPLG
jgi:quinol monooxygenase YgiN